MHGCFQSNQVGLIFHHVHLDAGVPLLSKLVTQHQDHRSLVDTLVCTPIPS